MSRPILVIRLGALGDIFLCRDVFHAIREHHRGERIVFLTRPQFAGLARQMPWFDEVWADTGPRFWQVAQWLALRRRLRGAGFARVYDLQSNDRTAAYFRLFGTPRTEWAGAIVGCSHRVPPFKPQRIHASDWFLQIAGAAGVLPAGPADLGWLNGPLEAFALPARFVVFVAGCAPHRPAKRWPTAHFARLAEHFLGAGLGVVLTGTGADQATLEEISGRVPAVLNLGGRTDIGQLAALARRTLAVVGNDTGPVHLMAAAGAPTLMLMSNESDPMAMGPRGREIGCLQVPALAELTADRVWRELPDQLPSLRPVLAAHSP